jgi:hypothetical protein
MNKRRKPIPRETIIRLLKTRGVICENCHERDFEHFHHIDGNRADNKDKNLMLLCVKCHNEVHTPITSNYKRIRIEKNICDELSEIGRKNGVAIHTVIYGLLLDYKKTHEMEAG